MLGFIIGTVCLVGLVKGYCAAAAGGTDAAGGHGCHAHGRFGGSPRRWFLRSIFERLETTPGQEKAIVAALDDLRADRQVLREEAQQTRADLARAFGGIVDEASLEETFARHDRLLARLRVGVVEALKKVHEALDDRQRKELADLVQGGRFGRAWM